jgi:hypothetical protein
MFAKKNATEYSSVAGTQTPAVIRYKTRKSTRKRSYQGISTQNNRNPLYHAKTKSRLGSITLAEPTLAHRRRAVIHGRPATAILATALRAGADIPDIIALTDQPASPVRRRRSRRDGGRACAKQRLADRRRAVVARRAAVAPSAAALTRLADIAVVGSLADEAACAVGGDGAGGGGS